MPAEVQRTGIVPGRGGHPGIRRDPPDAIRLLIVTAARSFEGTPFGHQGRRPGARLDCAGIAVCAYRAAGIDVQDRTDYTNPPPIDMLSSVLRRNLGDPVGMSFVDSLDGDVLVIEMGRMAGRARRAIHCGIRDGRGLWHVMQDERVCWVPEPRRWGTVVAVYGLR